MSSSTKDSQASLKDDIDPDRVPIVNKRVEAGLREQMKVVARYVG